MNQSVTVLFYIYEAQGWVELQFSLNLIISAHNFKAICTIPKFLLGRVNGLLLQISGQKVLKYALTFTFLTLNLMKLLLNAIYCLFVAGTTREHLGLAIALRIPLLVVITKTDLSSKETLDRTVKQLERILKSPGCNKVPIIVEDQDDVATAASNFPSGQ